MRKRVANILFKEWRVMFTDLNMTLLTTLLPLLIVGQGMVYIWAGASFGFQAMLASPVFERSLEKMSQAIPGILDLAAQDRFRVLLLNQFNFFLLLIPTVVAVTFASFSIVDEKLSGSLEALLATPVRTWELVGGYRQFPDLLFSFCGDSRRTDSLCSLKIHCF